MMSRGHMVADVVTILGTQVSLNSRIEVNAELCRESTDTVNSITNHDFHVSFEICIIQDIVFGEVDR